MRTSLYIILALGCLVHMDASASDPGSLSADGWLADAVELPLAQPTDISVLKIHGVVPQGVGGDASAVSVAPDGLKACVIAHGVGEFSVQRILVGGARGRSIVITAGPAGRLPQPDGRTAAARIIEVDILPIRTDPSSWRADADIAGAGLGLGLGWFQLEVWQGQRFRWMASEGELGIAREALVGDAVLTLTAEPGPGAAGADHELRLMACDGRMLDKVALPGRATVDLVIPSAARELQPLHLALAGAAKTPDDPRQLNLRVFAMAVQSSRAKP